MNNKKLDLVNGSVIKTLYRLAIPMICAQVINLLYNIVDRIFIGKLADGKFAMAGLGIASPIVMLISAFSVLIGMGGAPLAAIKLGKKDKVSAEKILGTCFSLLIIFSIILTLFFFLTRIKLLWYFGASTQTILYADSYLKIYLLGTIFVMITLGMNPFINTQGYTKTGMLSVLIGAITNIILDPLFIFTFHMGVAGAALASIIAQGIAMIWVVKFLFGSKTKLKLSKATLKLDAFISKKVLSLGIAPFIMHGSESLILIALNSQLLKYGGNVAVSSMVIISSLTQIIFLPLLGLAQGAQPIISFNYGAGNIARVKSTFKCLLINCLAYTLLITLIYQLFAPQIASFFTSDSEVISLTTNTMHIYFLTIGIFGAQIACQQTFLSLGKAKNSMMIVIIRKLILMVPLIYILPNLISDPYTGVILAEPITDLVSTTIAVLCFFYYYRKHLVSISSTSSATIAA